MTIRMFNEDLYMSEDDIQVVAKEVINTIKTKLPRKYHCECIVSAILSEVQNIVNQTTLNL